MFLIGKKRSFGQSQFIYKVVVICLYNRVKCQHTTRLQVMESIGVLFMWHQVRMAQSHCLLTPNKDLQEPQDLFVGRSSAFSATKSGVCMCCQEHLDTPLQ